MLADVHTRIRYRRRCVWLACHWVGNCSAGTSYRLTAFRNVLVAERVYRVKVVEALVNQSLPCFGIDDVESILKVVGDRCRGCSHGGEQEWKEREGGCRCRVQRRKGLFVFSGFPFSLAFTVLNLGKSLFYRVAVRSQREVSFLKCFTLFSFTNTDSQI